NPVHAYYNGSCTSKDNEDPSWSISFKTRRTSKTSSALKDIIYVVFVQDRNISLSKEYSPCIFNFMETGEEPTLMELYDVVCKVGDDLRVKPPDKINKRKANDELNYEHVTGRTKGFFFEPEECMPCSCDDCNSTSSSKEDEPEASSKA
ncbi:hypothetical protein Tco_1076834, partial [Tanacetum coccineum]